MAETVIAEERAGNDIVRWCLGQYPAEVDRRFHTGVDVGAAVTRGRPRNGR